MSEHSKLPFVGSEEYVLDAEGHSRSNRGGD